MRWCFAVYTLSILLAGCTHFPTAMSNDKLFFASTGDLPKTILVIDTLEKQILWKMEIPVGEKLVVQFHSNHTWTPTLIPATPPDRMRWCVVPIGEAMGDLHHERELPGHPIMVKMLLRDRKPSTGRTLEAVTLAE